MSLGRGIGSVEYLKKRIPKNAKYQNVKTRLDTGCSLTKYMEKMEEIKRNYRYRKDEIFKRLKVTTFSQLILQVAAVSDLNESADSESQCAENELALVSEADIESVSGHTNGSEASPHSERGDAEDSRDRCHTARSTLLSVISGVGELNLDTSNEKTRGESALGCEPWNRPYPDCPYLLLDVRDRDQYDCCHIISAHSFPIAMLSRTMNPYTKEVLAYKNAAGKIIILYDEDERIASQAATIMCQRGFENLFMLSGGLKVIAQKFPEGLVTGSIPTSCLSSPTSSAKRSSGPQPPSQPAERRWRFTADELCRIQEQLEEVQIPSNASSRMSSRMSACSSKSTACGSSSRQSSSSSSSTSRRSSARAQSSRPWNHHRFLVQEKD